MIFKQLQLSNFRVFNGDHNIDLSPRKDGLLNKPIVLFGGLNGAGKTTILTAIRLILLGRRANADAITKKEYQSYLAEQINKSALKDDENSQATIALEFTHTHQGEHKTYKVERYWGTKGEDTLVLFENGKKQALMNSDQVQSFLFDIIPPGIGDLFFFDGEKIAELAEDDTGTYLKEAVQKLLGINIIQRLSEDLQIFLKQEQNEHIGQKANKLNTKALEAEKEQYYAIAEESKNFASEIKGQISDIFRDIQRVEEDIAARGGDWAKTHEENKARFLEIEKDIAVEKSKLLHELDGSFPLALAPKAMQHLLETLTHEQEIKQQTAFNEKIPTHYAGLAHSLIAKLGDNKNNNNDEEALKAALKATIEQYFSQLTSNSENQTIQLDISDSDFYGIRQQRQDAIHSQQNVAKISSKLSELENEKTALEKELGKAPEETELVEQYEKLRKLETQKHKLEAERKDVLLEAKKYYEKALEIAKRLEKHYNIQKMASSIKKAKERIDAANGALSEFSSRLTALRVKQLEELFAASYRKLARKGDLKLEARIDPNTFDVTLMDAEGIAINRKSLSAGEKQIFAFAILEALGKLSGRILPVVVDTPLGRLDSHHRDRLVKHYFPKTAEQVILLSTDTEVDETFFKDMAHEISHGFEITFDQSSRCSEVTEGYFWENLQKEAV